VLLGGAAVILHGLSRLTKDFDIWQDPLPDPKSWATAIAELLNSNGELQAQRIGMTVPGRWEVIAIDEIPIVGSEDGLIRVVGTDRPIDIFYRPNELGIEDFEQVWQRSIEAERGLRLMEKIDLLITKQDTQRVTDITDIKFLEDRISDEYRVKLKNCSEREAKELLDRFATPEIAAFAFGENQDGQVKRIAWQVLDEMRIQGDPFAAELVREIQLRSHGLDVEL
jgi:hypothetical protein